MAKLLVSDKDYIVKYIGDDLEKLIKEKKDKLKSDLQKIVIDSLPKEVQEFMKKYPGWISKDSCSLRSILPSFFQRLNDWSIYIYPEIYGKQKIDKTLFEKKEFESQVNELCKLKKKCREIQNKTKCALEHIKTHKQLQNQFPEAYDILMNLGTKENQCDSIESLRAELSSIKKS